MPDNKKVTKLTIHLPDGLDYTVETFEKSPDSPVVNESGTFKLKVDAAGAADLDFRDAHGQHIKDAIC
jgi:hypothetical protein